MISESSVSFEELRARRVSVGFTDTDEQYLRKAGEVLANQVTQIVQHWRSGSIADIPNLARHSRSLAGEPLPDYLGKSNLRFEQWILDTCLHPYDQDWLNYQQEIALRHTSLRKNRAGQGAAFSDRWRTRQFEYTRLRNSMRDYADFWHVTQDALNYAAEESGITLRSEERTVLMAAYSALKPWPDGAAVVRKLRDRGLRLAVSSNMTPAMMQACLKASGLEEAFELALSTDRVGIFKPDPAAYQMGLDGFRLKRNQIAFAAFGGWDAAGAKRFGDPTFWVNRSGVPAEKLGTTADARYLDLSALPDFIEYL